MDIVRFAQIPDNPIGSGSTQGRRPVVFAADHGADRKSAIEQQANRGSPDRPGDEDRRFIGHGTVSAGI